MCGIVGYVGERNATSILLNGLKKLEYRGYDSSGIAILQNSGIETIKTKGRLRDLEEKISGQEIYGHIGVGHTRWATHGKPSNENSHPHTGLSGEIAVVHNGIIENYISLKDWLIEKGFIFKSETDTEVIAHLISYYYEGELLDAVLKALEKLKGSYALGIICSKNPEEIVVARKDSPLVVGIGKGENYIASDIPAILDYTRDVFLLDDQEIALVKKDSVDIFNIHGEKVNKEVFHVNWDVSAAEKGGYEHFMLKEIFEEPRSLKDTLYPRLSSDHQTIEMEDINLTASYLNSIDKIYIVACGSAYHAGLVGKQVIEQLTRIPVEVDIASEFRYRKPILSSSQIVIVISQSGETADTIAALRLAKEKGAHVIAIVNVVGSTISREADNVFYTWAGPEIAVATTKGYTTQLMALYILALELANRLGRIQQQVYLDIVEALKMIPVQAENILKNSELFKGYAKNHCNEKDVFFIGRGLDYAASMEGSLKLKEISYIHSEAYAAGELKHGTIALIEEGTLVVALATQEHLFEKMISNIKEVKARGAYVLALTMEGEKEIEKIADEVIYIPRVISFIAPILVMLPLQLFAYYIAVYKSCDVDKPRNLAKSVTVE